MSQKCLNSFPRKTQYYLFPHHRKSWMVILRKSFGHGSWWVAVFMGKYHLSTFTAFWKESMINQLSNRSGSAAKISQVLCPYTHTSLSATGWIIHWMPRKESYLLPSGYRVGNLTLFAQAYLRAKCTKKIRDLSSNCAANNCCHVLRK